MLTFGVIAPHPPLLILEIGGKDREKVKKTISALELAAKSLAAARPERLLMISPHADYGYKVPLYYLWKELPSDIELEKILVTKPSYAYYFALGKQYGEKIAASNRRTAVIASGDLSHALIYNSPYGYDPAGPKLDAVIVKAVREKDVKTLLHLDEDFLRHGAECGLRSILFLFGVFEGRNYSTEVLSYEGPFGVGYMVATFTIRE